MSPSETAIVKRDELEVFPLAGELLELIEFRENPDLTEDERKACDQAIDVYVEANVQETDRVRSVIRKSEVMAQIHREEARRQMELCDVWTARLELAKERIKAVMERLQIKSVEGRTGKVVLKANGGLAPLEIVQPAMVPDDYVRYEGRISGRAWKQIVACLELLGEDILTRDDIHMERVVSNTSVREGLKAGPVEGVRLGERGKHIEVK